MTDREVYERRGAMALITLNRPDALKAFPAETIAEIRESARRAERDPQGLSCCRPEVTSAIQLGLAGEFRQKQGMSPNLRQAFGQLFRFVASEERRADKASVNGLLGHSDQQFSGRS